MFHPVAKVASVLTFHPQPLSSTAILLAVIPLPTATKPCETFSVRRHKSRLHTNRSCTIHSVYSRPEAVPPHTTTYFILWALLRGRFKALPPSLGFSLGSEGCQCFSGEGARQNERARGDGQGLHGRNISAPNTILQIVTLSQKI